MIHGVIIMKLPWPAIVLRFRVFILSFDCLICSTHILGGFRVHLMIEWSYAIKFTGLKLRKKSSQIGIKWKVMFNSFSADVRELLVRPPSFPDLCFKIGPPEARDGGGGISTKRPLHATSRLKP